MDTYTFLVIIVMIISILAGYGIYAVTNPHVNGLMFGSVMATIAGIGAGALGFKLRSIIPPDGGE